MEEFIDFLNRIKPLSDALTEHLTKIMVVRKLNKKALLVHSGRVNNNFFFIVQGLVRSYYRKGNKEVSLWFLKENDIIASAESYRTQQPSKEIMEALEDCIVISGNFMELEKTYELFPELERHGRIITQKYSSLWYSLLFGIRMQTAAERYQFLRDKFPELLLRAPSKHLASFLSISEITLKRIRGRR
jgi:CRP-like cAMP-binding protein